MLAGGVTERVIAARISISRAAVGRHRRNHLTPMVQATARALTRDQQAKRERAATVAALDANDPKGWLGISAIVADQRRNHGRMNAAVDRAGDKGQYQALTGLSNAVTRSNEARARWGGIDRPQGDADGPAVTITINFGAHTATTDPLIVEHEES